MHPENAGRVFVLRAIDPNTASIAHEARFEVADAAALCALLQMPLSEFDPAAYYELDPEDVTILVQHFHLDFDAGASVVELHPWHPNDELPYCVHTGRELALMLAGTKPLAAFIDVHPSLHGAKVIPEREFEPHVAAGRIVKREEITPPAPDAPMVRGQRIGTRRMLYALPSEVWRIEAYLLLWKTAETSGWSAGFERMEGTLLGYEDWQNDYHIERRYSSRSRRSSDDPGGLLRWMPRPHRISQT
jgi:hypothetical protein